jgi:hypothetical protein
MKSLVENFKKQSKNVVAMTKDLIEGDETRPANWEPQENVSYCRNCDMKFDSSNKAYWKHHCRKCGNVVCESCLRMCEDNKKFCLGCIRGEAPGDKIVTAATDMLLDDPNAKKQQSKLKARRFIDSGLAQMKNIFDADEILVVAPVARRILLLRGSVYGEDGRDPVNRRAPLPISGYFEFLNKSLEVCCLKLLYCGGDYLYETPRPSYIAGTPLAFPAVAAN